MTYNKPEVSILGAAEAVINNCSNKTCSTGDGNPGQDPAYDLDE